MWVEHSVSNGYKTKIIPGSHRRMRLLDRPRPPSPPHFFGVGAVVRNHGRNVGESSLPSFLGR